MNNNDLVLGLPKFNRDCVLPICEPCCKVKPTRTIMPMRNPTFKYQLELVHADVWGSSHVATIGGSRIFLAFIDDYLIMVWIYFMT